MQILQIESCCSSKHGCTNIIQYKTECISVKRAVVYVAFLAVCPLLTSRPLHTVSSIPGWIAVTFGADVPMVPTGCALMTLAFPPALTYRVKYLNINQMRWLKSYQMDYHVLLSSFPYEIVGFEGNISTTMGMDCIARFAADICVSLRTSYNNFDFSLSAIIRSM